MNKAEKEWKKLNANKKRIDKINKDTYVTVNLVIKHSFSLRTVYGNSAQTKYIEMCLFHLFGNVSRVDCCALPIPVHIAQQVQSILTHIKYCPGERILSSLHTFD